MINIMYSRYVLTIGAFIVVLMMDIIYFSKAKKNDILKHKLYSYFIIANTLVLLVELIIMILFGSDISFKICSFVLKIRDVILMSYFCIVFFYYHVSINNINYDSFLTFLKTEKILRPNFIFTLVVFIIHIFLPYTEVTKETFSATYSGPAFYLTIGYCVIITLEIIFVSVLRNRHGIKYSEKLSLIWLFVLMMVILIGQVLLDEVVIMGLISSVYILVLYFIFENPDLEVIEEIDTLTKEVEQANNSKIDLLSNISKEMISPMNSIVILSESILNKNYDTNKVREDIKQIELSSRNFLEIVNNTLDVSNIDNDKETLYEKEYSLINILNSLINIVEEKTATKNISLVLNIDKSIPSNLIGDFNKLYQVLLNIISNSIKYTEVGKITVNLSKEMQNNGIILKFKISDTGIGIKEEDYNKLFVKYSRLDEAVSRGIEGTGLGLSIVKKYVDLLGGKISFDSTYAVGTNFYIDIPQKIANMNETLGDYKAPVKSDEKHANILDCSNYKILIVEDDTINLEVTKRLLERYRFNIETCTSGKECIYKYKEGNQYDMMFIDHIMPEMSGIEIMQVIKQLKEYKTPILVALTANAFADSKEMYLREGFDDYLSKPVDLMELDELINKYFNK